MRLKFLSVLAFTAATPAAAAVIAPTDAADHVGQVVTVEGRATVFTPSSGKVTFVDLGGTGWSEPFTAVIFASDASKFPAVESYGGKIVDVTGTVQIYEGKPEIILKTADQVKVAQ